MVGGRFLGHRELEKGALPDARPHPAAQPPPPLPRPATVAATPATIAMISSMLALCIASAPL